MMTQHTTKHKVIGFGEKVYFLFKVPANKRNACDNDKSGVGYMVGVLSRNTEYLVAIDNGVIACSTVRRLPNDDGDHQREI